MFCSGPQQQQKYAEQGGKPDPKYLDRLCFYINALGMITKHCDWFQTIEDTITHGLITVTCIMPRLHGPLQWLLALVSKTHTPAIPNTVTTREWLFSFVLIEWDKIVCRKYIDPVDLWLYYINAIIVCFALVKDQYSVHVCFILIYVDCSLVNNKNNLICYMYYLDWNNSILGRVV